MQERRNCPIPSYDYSKYTHNELLALMNVSTSRNTPDRADIDALLRDILVYMVLRRASDLHLNIHFVGGVARAMLSIREPGGFTNFEYTRESAGYFKEKLFLLTGTPQGGTTPDIISTRFGCSIPGWVMNEHGIDHPANEPYELDWRVQFFKTVNDGCKFVLRLLDQQRAPNFDNLGLSEVLKRSILRVINEPSGLVLVSGPTGSGKTTLLSAILGVLNDGQRSILTIENPVENRIKVTGPIAQMQIGGGITFASALRSGMRADPDVILVGEIRDQETMEIALQAAQTGHLVLSTIHSNSAPETVSRALDLTADKKRDSTRLAETLKYVIAQRLVDKYEGNTVERAVTNDEEIWLKKNGINIGQIAEPEGVKTGKIPVLEAIEINHAIKEAVREGEPTVARIYGAAKEQLQFETLAQAGVRAVYNSAAKLNDVMSRVETTSEAEEMPGIRARVCTKFGVNLDVVAQWLDEYVQRQHAGERMPGFEDYCDEHYGE
jgi:energy-coupling factor transporter ATP-binding protein EcfA2